MKQAGTGAQQDHDVQDGRPVIDVPNIELDALSHKLNRLRFSAITVYLRPASNPRLNVITIRVISDDLFVF